MLSKSIFRTTQEKGKEPLPGGDDGGSDEEDIVDQGADAFFSSKMRCVIIFPFSVERGGVLGMSMVKEQSRNFHLDIFNGEMVECKDGKPIKLFLISKILHVQVMGKQIIMKKLSKKVGKLKTKSYKFQSDEDASKFAFYITSRNLFGEHIRDAFIRISDTKYLHRASILNIDRNTVSTSVAAVSSDDLAILTVKRHLLEQALRLADLTVSPEHVGAMLRLATKVGERGIDFVRFYRLLWKSPVYNDRQCLLEWLHLAATEQPESFMREVIDGEVKQTPGKDFGLKFKTSEPQIVEGEDVMVSHDAVRCYLDAGKSPSSCTIPLNGSLYVTNFRLILVSCYPSSPATIEARRYSRYWHLDVTDYWKTFSCPLTSISSISSKDSVINIVCKDLRRIKMHLPLTEQLQHKVESLINVISGAAFSGSLEKCFAFHYSPDYGGGPDTWNFCDVRTEYKRMGITSCKEWRVFDNSNFALCATYPPYVAVPSYLSDEQLAASAAFRSKDRLPVINYRHSNGTVMSRSSQPLVGLGNKSCDADIEMLKAYRMYKDSRDSSNLAYYILDARGYLAATANRAAGKGTEDKSLYPNTALEYQNIGNIHVMRKSITDLGETVMPGGHGEDNSCILRKIEDSGWLNNLSLILKASVHGAERMHVQCASILTHCSDGWDRTSQICAIIKILLDPFYRTIEGFAYLVEMEFCSFGFKFTERIGCGMDSDKMSEQRSPVFLQFLDCVWQIMKQFPAAFEFTEELLVFVGDHVHSSLFGNFLGDYYQYRHNILKVSEKTRSIWQFILPRRHRFANAHFTELDAPIWPSVSLKSVTLWPRYFLRWFPEAHPRPGSGIVWNDSLHDK